MSQKEYIQKLKDRFGVSSYAHYRGLTRISADGMISPSKVQHVEPINRFILDGYVRQEGGSPSLQAGYVSLGNGGYMHRRSKGLA